MDFHNMGKLTEKYIFYIYDFINMNITRQNGNFQRILNIY